MIIPNILVLFDNTLFNIYNNYVIFTTLFFVIALLVFSPRGLKFSEFIFILFSIVFLFMNSVLNTKSYGSALTLLLSFLIIIVIGKIQIKRGFYWILYILMALFNVFLFYKSLVYSNTGFIDFNSNQIAMNMFISYMFIIVLSRYLKPSKIIELLFLVFTIIGVNNFSSRTTFISLIFFVLFIYLIPRKVLLKTITFRILYLWVLLLSFIIPYLYTYTWIHSIQFRIEIMGKRFFTGRELMWLELFDSLDSLSHILFGLGDRMTFSSELVNAHNASLHIVMTSGLIACVLYYALIISKFELLVSKKFRISNLGIECLIAFLTTIIYTYFENPLQPIRMILIYLFLAIYIKELSIENHKCVITSNLKSINIIESS